MNQVRAFCIEPLDCGIKLTVEVDHELRVEELVHQAEVAEVFQALDLLELVRNQNLIPERQQGHCCVVLTCSPNTRKMTVLLANRHAAGVPVACAITDESNEGWKK